jgi:hypothetical protein
LEGQTRDDASQHHLCDPPAGDGSTGATAVAADLLPGGPAGVGRARRCGRGRVEPWSQPLRRARVPSGIRELSGHQSKPRGSLNLPDRIRNHSPVRLRAVQHGGSPGRLMHRAGPRLRWRAMPSTEDGWVRAGGGCCSVTSPSRPNRACGSPAHGSPMSSTDVLDDACLVGEGRRPAAAVRWDSNPVPTLLRRQRSDRWTARDLRFSLTERDRSCPPRTSGS